MPLPSLPRPARPPPRLQASALKRGPATSDETERVRDVLDRPFYAAGGPAPLPVLLLRRLYPLSLRPFRFLRPVSRAPARDGSNGWDGWTTAVHKESEPPVRPRPLRLAIASSAPVPVPYASASAARLRSDASRGRRRDSAAMASRSSRAAAAEVPSSSSSSAGRHAVPPPSFPTSAFLSSLHLPYRHLPTISCLSVDFSALSHSARWCSALALLGPDSFVPSFATPSGRNLNNAEPIGA
ncbi:hypothetical protein CDD83_209 [Cordyceps sp. RAO-2017]|nr:hypothetical protein CDD83_209 [Cordyceps sp. RAO-2017]